MFKKHYFTAKYSLGGKFSMTRHGGQLDYGYYDTLCLFPADSKLCLNATFM
jgi:hypothetical protein